MQPSRVYTVLEKIKIKIKQQPPLLIVTEQKILNQKPKLEKRSTWVSEEWIVRTNGWENEEIFER